MAKQKAYVREDGTTVLKCPYCNYSRAVSVTALREKKRVITVRCACQKSYSVYLELRKMFRKSSSLRGNYINHSQQDDRGVLIQGKIVVRDISMGGIGFETIGKCSIQKEDELEVTFTLDDKYSTVIKKRVEVKIVRGKYVGCEFTHANEYDKDLGFYLLP
jgi:PilZ domain